MVYSRGYGRAGVEHDVPFTTRTVFDIGSTSKQVVAAAIVLLAQDGKLSLDDDIRKPTMSAELKPGRHTPESVVPVMFVVRSPKSVVGSP
jgi:CubicO group peptidase (beta-lactamase class C family)